MKEWSTITINNHPIPPFPIHSLLSTSKLKHHEISRNMLTSTQLHGQGSSGTIWFCDRGGWQRTPSSLTWFCEVKRNNRGLILETYWKHIVVEGIGNTSSRIPSSFFSSWCSALCIPGKPQMAGTAAYPVRGQILVKVDGQVLSSIFRSGQSEICRCLGAWRLFVGSQKWFCVCVRLRMSLQCMKKVAFQPLTILSKILSYTKEHQIRKYL